MKLHKIQDTAIQRLESITVACNAMSDIQLVTMNKLRRMNGKKEVKSWDEHRRLKAIGK